MTDIQLKIIKHKDAGNHNKNQFTETDPEMTLMAEFIDQDIKANIRTEFYMPKMLKERRKE